MKVASDQPTRWQHSDLLAVAAILMVAAAVRLVFFLHAPIFFEGDARGYLLRAVEISTGEGFQFTLKRTPGYPLFMASVFGVAGPSLEAVALAQHFLGIVTALLTYGCARQIAGRAAGLIAGLATALSGSMLIYEHVMLTESLFTLLIAAAVWLAILGVSNRSWLWLLLSGVVASLSAMIRPVGLVLAFVIPPLTLCLIRREAGVRLAGVFLVAFGLVMSPWVLRNALVHGEAEVVHPGRFLIARTFRHNPTGISMYSGGDKPGESQRMQDGRAILRAIEEERPSSFEAHSALVRRMRLSDAEASDLLRDLAIDAILRSPDVYAMATWMELGVLVFSEPESVAQHVEDRRQAWRGDELLDLVKDGTIPELIPTTWDADSHLAIAEAAASVYQPAHWNGLLLVLSVIAAAWGARNADRRAVLFPLGTVAGIALCTVLVNGSLPRYRYPMDPLLHVAAASSVVWLVAWVRAGLRRPSIALHRRPGTAEL
jgi:4-amino-4-deoxy-L-arabinose transferase-like glycosyltransferase